MSLMRAGFDVSSPAFYLWEGVTQYLSEDAVRQTMSFLAKAAPGSRLGFTYVLADFLAGKDMYGAAAMHKCLVEGHRVWTFGLEPEKVNSWPSLVGRSANRLAPKTIGAATSLLQAEACRSWRSSARSLRRKVILPAEEKI